MKKLKVTLKNADFAYTVVMRAKEKTQMKVIQERARKKIKKQYNFEIPADAEFDIEFEIVD